MTVGIYQIKNIKNNKKYIGQSINIEKRKAQHFSELRNNTHINKHLQHAFNKYGENAFIFEIIKACKPRYLNRLEKMYIRIYDTYNNGYNQTKGGDNPPVLIGKNNPFYNKRHSYESCIKMSRNNNSTGYFRVYYTENRYKYRWYDSNGKRKSLSSVNINKLKEKVMSKGLPWHKI